MKKTEKKENKQSKILSVHDTKAGWGSRGIVEPILNLDRDEWSNSYPIRFTFRKKHLYRNWWNFRQSL
jgi:hypothetical protein